MSRTSAAAAYPASIDNEYGALTSAIWGRGTPTRGWFGMAPASPAGRLHGCSRCPTSIEPDEPYYLSRDGEVAWCDTCEFEEMADL